MVDKRFIVSLQGKEFILYDGLLDMAHQMELQSIKTEMVQYDGKVVIFRATATTKDGKSFDGYGDATTENVNKMIAKHMIRMAETRAKARALRDLTNVGMCSVEELGGDDAATYEKAKQTFSGKATEAQRQALGDAAKTFDISADAMVGKMDKLFGVKSSKDLTSEQASELLATIQAEHID